MILSVTKKCHIYISNFSATKGKTTILFNLQKLILFNFHTKIFGKINDLIDIFSELEYGIKTGFNSTKS